MNATPTTEIITCHDPSWWLRTRIHDAVTTWTRCHHLTANPHLPAIVPLWHHRVLCHLCAFDAALGPGTPADRTCDRCATVVPAGAVFNAAIYTEHPHAVLIGLCEPCKRKEMP